LTYAKKYRPIIISIFDKLEQLIRVIFSIAHKPMKCFDHYQISVRQ